LKTLLSKLWNKCPANVRIPLDILRRYPYWKRAGVIFVHIPKSAGVAINTALYNRPLGHFFATDIQKVIPNAFDTLLTFGVVRNPLDRLVSAYRFAKSGGTSQMGIKNPNNYHIKEFRSFDTFVSEWLVNQNLSDVDGIFKPQYFYLCDQDKIIVDHVIYFENLDHDIQFISKQIGRKINLTHLNKSVLDNISNINFDTINLVKKIYAKDYQIFNYSII